MTTTLHTPSTLSWLEFLKHKVFKTVTLVVFFCLPQKLTKVFVSLSIVTMILKLRDRDLHNESNLLVRIEGLLKINLCESILVLPDQTLTWFWGPGVLGKRLQVGDKNMSLYEVLLDGPSLLHNRNQVLDLLLENLPRSIRYKLKLSEVKNRLAVKHNIIGALIYT